MKYFTSEFMGKLLHGSILEREKADMEILELFERNDRDYNSLKGNFSNRFNAFYSQNADFHDAIIREIFVSCKRGRRITIRLQLCCNGKLYWLTYCDVTQYLFSVPDTSNWFFPELTCSYSEFEQVDKTTFKHSMICDSTNEIQITFRKISIKLA